MKRNILFSILVIFLLIAVSTTAFKIGEINSVAPNLHKIDLYGTIDGYKVHIKGTVTIEVEWEPVMTTVVIPSDADDGYLYKGDTIYNSCHDALTSNYFNNVADLIELWYGYMPYYDYYYIERAVSFFDTSSIPISAVIDSAKITYILQQKFIFSSDFDIVIQNGQPTHPSKPIIASDYNYLYYSGNGGSINTSALPAVNNPFYINLNAMGLNWINKGGTTKFMIIVLNPQ